MSTTQQATDCQVCGQSLSLAQDLMMGELVDCGACGTEFEVTATEPLSLQEAPMVGEDWGQ
jgi:alpha-aminoadipate carrier protein LysW